MKVKSICELIEEVAPLSLQEKYDNAGLLVGNNQMEVIGVLICIDVTEKVLQEAIEKNCNLIVSHHPLIFSGLKKIIGQNEVQRCVISAIKNNIAIYAAHTNLDNVLGGVNGKIATKIGLKNIRILQPKEDGLLKLSNYVPRLHLYAVRNALFNAGAGHIGNYNNCSFSVQGHGTFKANDNAHPFVGQIDELHTEPEMKIEVILPKSIKDKVIEALLQSHPYEEPAYDIIPLENTWNEVGAGIIGELEESEETFSFLERIKQVFNVPAIRHTEIVSQHIKRVALCGGSGSFLLKEAIYKEADIFISGDFKYHEFFEADKNILIADIGHFESEQFTKDIFYEIITKKIPTFAVQISETKTNPINYL